jgi:TolB-like protein
MAEDEARTLAALKALRSELFDPKVAQYNGRIIKLMGDGALIEFASVVDAVLFAVEVQQHLSAQHTFAVNNQSLTLRIGINLGDVIIEDDDVYGDGVNLAARLEGLAKPGGICVRRAVRNQVRDKVDLTFVDEGEIEVKNIPRAVRVFSITLDDKAEALTTPVIGTVDTSRLSANRRWIAAVFGITMLPFLGFLAWQFWPGLDAASPTATVLQLPDKPSVAIMPFRNLSKDQSHDYFADAMAESISSGLSRFSGLFVVSSDATGVYKQKTVTARQVGRDLGVRYVLEGNVQKGSERMRVSVQLADTVENNIVWTSSYDQPLEDILVIQDKIMEQISSTLSETIWKDAARKLDGKPLKNFSAYDFTLKGLDHLHRVSKQDNLRARELFIKSREIDRDIYLTPIGLGWTWFLEWRFGWDPAPDALQRAAAEAENAVKINPHDGEAFRLLARINLQWRNFDQALALSERAIELSPSSSDIMAAHALVLNYLGRPKDAIGWALKALRLNPNHPVWYPHVLADGYYLDGQYENVVRTLGRKSFFLQRDRWALAAAYAQLGRKDEAANQVAALLEKFPAFNLTSFKKRQPFRNASDLNHYVDGLRKAGIPD